MKTLLSRFCEEFDAALRPLLPHIGAAAESLNQVSGQQALRALLTPVQDLRHHLATLADKVAEQQAYVLIFGPLKSGKSTLMNAIAGAYVSEVTALPAYPTMVFVRHAAERRFTVTRYNGETQGFADMDSMRSLMEWAHNELADRLREVEARGEEFDPQQHIPQAIRRVDVRLPANHLAESSAVLVDTPGLYSRMKFGYDRLTREFRNTAASAIFVVKTDNLFLEQVFAEFEELLALFSRVFLVVNIDSTKRDLYPDGHLGPSLESQQPERIVAAYQNLSMTGPLRRAVDEGRLHIYPVDLLQAASQRMLGLDDDAPSAGVAGFHAFLGDLSDYLNSTEYLVAFLSDSLRQAFGLLVELQAIDGHPAVSGMRAEVARLEERQRAFAGREQAIALLQRTAWEGAFAKLGEDLSSIGGGRIEALRELIGAQVAAGLDHWFAGDGSYQSLLEQDLAPSLAQMRDDLANTVGGVLGTVAVSEFAGGHPADEVKAALATLGLSLGQVGGACMASLDPVEGLAPARSKVTTAVVPVKRGLLDYLLLRRHTALQRRLFGPVDAPTRAVPRALKVRKLGDAARAILQRSFEVDFGDYLSGAREHISHQVLANYLEGLRKGLRGELTRLKDELVTERTSVEQGLAESRSVITALERLSQACGATTTNLSDLARRYGDADPETLRKPLADAAAAAVKVEVAADPGAEVRSAPGAAGEPAAADGTAGQSLSEAPPSAAAASA